MELLFWLSLALLFYIYFGYPILLAIVTVLKDSKQNADIEPNKTVSIIIPAFNEASVIKGTISNKLTQIYPADLIEIIVVSDESDDGTDDIVKTMSRDDSRIRLLRQSPRKGKTSGLNMAIQEAKGELVVFSDANSHYDENAIAELVKCFDDEKVGYVTGKMLYVNEDGSLIGDGCSAYMRYENILRAWESEIGSVVGVDGGVDAVRKSLYQEMNQDQLPDFVLPLKVVTQGKQVKYCEKAILHEETLQSSDAEYKMRVRVSLRAYWAMWDMKHLFNVFKYRFFSIQFFSHKLLRYLAFFPMLLLFLSNLILAFNSSFFQVLLLGQLVFYGIVSFPLMGLLTQNSLVRFAYYFVLLNFASAMAFLRFVKGEKIVMWKPRVG